MLRKSKLINISICFILLSCNLEKPHVISDKLFEEIGIEIENGYVILLSEFDCASCVNKLPLVLDNLSKENIEIIGLYWQNNKNSIFMFSETINSLNSIKWMRIKQEDLYYFISETSTNKKGPFLVKIEKYSYKYTMSLSDM